MSTRPTIYDELGVRPVINARGNMTVLGGSMPTVSVRAAMEEAGTQYVEMKELLEQSGLHIADILGTEAAYVTSGCGAALALSAAACIAGNRPEDILRLPDTTGMKNEIIIQKSQRYSYDRCYTVTGGKLVEVGTKTGCTQDQLERAIGSSTAAIAYFIQPDWGDSAMSLEETVEIAHANNIPVIADAAYQIYPLDYFRGNAISADLVCFGAKYLGAPHSTGFVCGRRDLVSAVTDHGFIGFHTEGAKAIGRPMKVDRQDIVGVVAALREWFATDHESRLMDVEVKLSTIQNGLQGIPNVVTKLVQVQRFWGFSLHIIIDSSQNEDRATSIVRDLAEGTPRIWVEDLGTNTIAINAHALNDGEEKLVADRVRDALLG